MCCYVRPMLNTTTYDFDALNTAIDTLGFRTWLHTLVLALCFGAGHRGYIFVMAWLFLAATLWHHAHLLGILRRIFMHSIHSIIRHPGSFVVRLLVG